MSIVRLPHDAATEVEVRQYYDTRSRQLLHEGYQWNGELAWAPGFVSDVYEVEFTHRDTGTAFASYFALPHARGKGHLRKLVALGKPIITLPDCNIEDALRHVDANYRVVGLLTDTREYQLIQEEYGNKRAKRSQAFLMNHIDEGLAVMAAVGASTRAMRAFCLHPLLQSDKELTRNFERVSQTTAVDSPAVIALAMEYRSVANEYLSHCVMRPGGIWLSPLKDVNDMLIGDKVQNRKDFERYHADSHDNRARLAEYFREWCEALGVADRYAELKALLPA